MRTLLSLALLIAPLGLTGCGGETAADPPGRVELTAEQIDQINAADARIEDEEQGQKLTRPAKGPARKR